jgi:ActR/RegA family two-component response regulator
MQQHKNYMTAVEDDGINYREIASTMTELGFKMNHSSARNHVLRIMRKFIDEFAKQYNLKLSDDVKNNVVKVPMFQRGIADLLQEIESERRSSE